MVPQQKRNPSFSRTLSLLQPRLYHWQVIISPINPASFIPAFWRSFLRQKLIVISSHHLPESFLPKCKGKKSKVKIGAHIRSSGGGGGGDGGDGSDGGDGCTLQGQVGARQTDSRFSEHIWRACERWERGDWLRISIRPELNLLYGTTEHESGWTFRRLLRIGIFWRRMQIAILSILWFSMKEQCAVWCLILLIGL